MSGLSYTKDIRLFISKKMLRKRQLKDFQKDFQREKKSKELLLELYFDFD